MITLQSLKLMILFAAILFVLYVFASKAYIFMLEETPLENIRVEPGDIILFRWKTVAYLHEVVSSFTHIGIVIEIDGTFYILETHLKGDTKNMGFDVGGVNIYDLKERIRSYEGDTFVMKMKDDVRDIHNRHVSKEELNAMILENLEEFKQIPFYDNYKDKYETYCIPRMICKQCVSRKRKRGMFCSEFIGYILQQMGIIDDSVEIDCFTPQTFVTLRNGNGRVFGEVKKIRK